ncbi:MAG: sulfite exporter TauE/SafE family protein [Planctomyces sp.]|nr:sulfite exporter TauE/SafE family protein [Planctomyces sp.]
MIATLSGIVLASLLGSAHCAGMCGAIATMSLEPARGAGAGSRRAGGGQRARAAVAYHAGRLVSYALLGALAGVVGTLVDRGGDLAGVRRVAGVLASLAMVGCGLGVLLVHAGCAVRWPRLPGVLGGLASRAHRVAWGLPMVWRAGAIGLLTALLPCGWLYVFVTAAAGTGSPVGGAALMAAFWLGTVPALAAVGLGARSVLARARLRSGVVSAAAMIVLGGVLLWAGAAAPAGAGPACPLCDTPAPSEPSAHALGSRGRTP